MGNFILEKARMLIAKIKLKEKNEAYQQQSLLENEKQRDVWRKGERDAKPKSMQEINHG